MKIQTLIFNLILLPTVLLSQSIFDKYEDIELVSSVVVNQKMFNMRLLTRPKR
jgi:uncharacterized protein YkvS